MGRLQKTFSAYARSRYVMAGARPASEPSLAQPGAVSEKRPCGQNWQKCITPSSQAGMKSLFYKSKLTCLFWSGKKTLLTEKINFHMSL